MSKKRIVKETLADGTIQYRVEVFWRPFFWMKRCWVTDTIEGCPFDAVFSTLGDAELHAFGYPKSKKVVKREILNYE